MAVSSLVSEVSTTSAQSHEVAFLPILGHDLRSPLTALKGRLQLLHKRLGRQPGRDADVLDIQRMMYHVERISHHLDIVRDASQLLHGEFTLVRAQTDLVTLLRRVAGPYDHASSHGRVVIETGGEPIVGYWDGERIAHALNALIANGLRFGAEGSAVVVRAWRDGGCARIDVIDDGIGVPEMDREAIFQLGRRGSNAEQRGGAGLGLFVAREVIMQHGGQVSMRPRPEGGSVFAVSLPLEQYQH
ncbi:MAG TPA: HAMP domain-containing sensor histidine kinase [Ktedonobacterales bacterium]